MTSRPHLMTAHSAGAMRMGRMCSASARKAVLVWMCVLLLEECARVNALVDTPLSPSFQSIPNGTYAIWQIPAQPRAILFFAHGRSHERAENFWDATANCAVCSSLPEERLITKAALARGYAVVSIQAGAGGESVWQLSPDPDENQDVRMVVRFLQQWRREQGMEHLPLTVMGVSMGGSFVSLLALASDLRIAGKVLMVSMGGDSTVLAQAVSYPPVFFCHMPRDWKNELGIQHRMQELSARGIAVQDVSCNPLPINETFFAERIVGLEAPVSAAIYQELVAQGYLDSDGFLRAPQPGTPVEKPWEFEDLVQSLHLQPVEGFDWPWVEASVAMELSLAFAFHAATSLKSAEMLDWLDSTWNARSHALPQLQ